MSSDERRMAVLQAIVQDYVHTSEPVGSRALLERHQLGVSAATVRNDMAVLEEEGLITAPHTSAGRIPTDLGYRVFVDRLSEIKPLSAAEKTAIADFLGGAVDLDDVVERTVRLLSQLTHQVAVMQYPSLARSVVQHIELVPLGGSRLMIVLILATGRVEQRVLDAGQDLTTPEAAGRLADLRARLNAAADGTSLPRASANLSLVPDELAPELRDLARAVIRTLDDALVEEREERVVMAGTANLARVSPEFPRTIGPVLEALEEHVVLLRLFGNLATDLAAGGITVSIGRENDHLALAGASVVSTGYGTGTDVLAGLGVLGPTRMDYPTTMAYVRSVATYVSTLLAS